MFLSERDETSREERKTPVWYTGVSGTKNRSVMAKGSYHMFQTPQKGSLVTLTRTGQSGIVVSVAYNEWSGQHIVTVRVPGTYGTHMWNEAAVVPATTADALAVGDMIIALDHDGGRHVGTVTGKTLDGKLVARFALGVFKVDVERVWRAWPAQSLAVAS
jgi:hypothetical protein